jgi:RNA polymerase sigma factor (sigma-70 family)
MNNSEIILNQLKAESNGTYREMYALYFDDVRRFIMARKGSMEDAEDIFQDTMVILIEKLRRDNFQLTASLKTYIVAIAKYNWFKKYKTAQKETFVTAAFSNEFYLAVDDAVVSEKTYWERIKTAMHKITGHCNRLLQDMFFKNKPAAVIQKEYGYSSLHNTQNQKYKCLNQIRQAVEAEKKSAATGD